MDKNQSVAVLLATYNGEKYLAEQLDSIIKQKDINVHIIARDDGSTDKTVAMLHQCSKKYAHKITVISKNSNENGHLANFSALCEYALTTSFEYFCFADQDDVWHEDKLKLLFTDIDAPAYVVETTDIYSDMIQDSHLYDFSGYVLPKRILYD